MESKPDNDADPLNTSEEIRKKAREELNRQLQGLLNNQPIEKLTEENIEDEVNRLMEEVDNYEKNYVPKEVDENAYNELKKFEEEFGKDLDDEKEESDNNNKNEIIDTSSEKKNEIIKNEKKEQKEKKEKKEKKTKFDLNFEIEDLEDLMDEEDDVNDKKSKNKNEDDIKEDKVIKKLLDEYEKQLNIEVEREVEKEFKPKMDANDIKRANDLLKKDPLINEAIVQGLITKDELILFIDYYEIFSLTTKAKKVTNEHLKALDDLCLKKNKKEENDINENNKSKNKKIDLNDEDAINKLTSEIEKKLENSEDILNKKLDYEKLMMNTSNGVKKENLQKILDKYNKDKNKEKINNRELTSSRTDKSNVSHYSDKTDKTGFTNYSNNGFNINNVNINTNNKKEREIIPEDNRPHSTRSEISNFTTEELMSVPKYTIYQKNNKEKEKESTKTINKDISSNDNNNINTSNLTSETSENKINNKTFYKTNNNGDKELLKPKGALKPLSRDIVKSNRNSNLNNINNSNISSASYVHTVSGVTGKKTIPPIRNNKKTKTNERVDLFDDDANPLNMGKYRDARKDLIKLKMGGKSKMHELFSDKPRNLEENEKLRQKFIDFIQNGKEHNKNSDTNALKKSIVRKKIEEAQMFNKLKK